MVNNQFWQHKKILITGHTGFKGSWLSTWLLHLGAEVYGYALKPDTTPSLFNQLQLDKKLHHKIGDIRNKELVAQIISNVKPDVIIHMAAQPLVRQSYIEPSYTWETNVMGTIHVLEASKILSNNCAVVIVTTDKVYENRNSYYGYRETDQLGGFDPYSSSKAATELAVNSWRNSFFRKNHPVKIASARAGNVIGGGDWAKDRIIPDSVKSLLSGLPIKVRNPHAVRPWQHVLEPLSGYLLLAERLYETNLTYYQEAFNFGPTLTEGKTVKNVVEHALRIWPGEWIDESDPNALHEMELLNVSIDKAINILKWQPKWNFEETISHTINWYLKQYQGESAFDLTIQQIEQYQLK